jgi:exonuclease VII large subunit
MAQNEAGENAANQGPQSFEELSAILDNYARMAPQMMDALIKQATEQFPQYQKDLEAYREAHARRTAEAAATARTLETAGALMEQAQGARRYPEPGMPHTEWPTRKESLDGEKAAQALFAQAVDVLGAEHGQASLNAAMELAASARTTGNRAMAKRAFAVVSEVVDRALEQNPEAVPPGYLDGFRDWLGLAGPSKGAPGLE